MKDIETKDHQLTVALRIRPLSDSELEESATIVAHRVDDQMVVLMDPPGDHEDVLRANRSREKAYMFDVAFDYSTSQEELYRATTKGLIHGLISGYNATVFAYGPTGCGKTYTMLGTDKDPGIYVRTLNDLFHSIEETSDSMMYSVSMSYLEIYNEMIRDLLNPTSGFLDLREDSKGEIQVAGITEVSTVNAQEIMELLVKGNRQRTQEPTAANRTSSRSHALLQVCVKRQDLNQEVRFGRLFMIDLAGSERAAQTQNTGQRLKEGAHINRSLLALGNCINALSDKNAHRYVNYRDSKLTRLLKDSLGGNSRTVMIAHISPASIAFEESRNTLSYADRAKHIRTRVKKNMTSVSHHIAQYTSIITELRGEIQRLQTKINEQQRQSSNKRDIRHVQAEVLSQSRPEVQRLREQLLQGFREQMEIRKTLMDLDSAELELQVETSHHLLTIADWEQEQNQRSRKRRSEQQKERKKDTEWREKDSDQRERDSDSSESETADVSSARESLLQLMSEQKRIHRDKASFERRLAQLKVQAGRLEERLPHTVSCESQRQVLELLCKVHELELDQAELRSSSLLKDSLLRRKDQAMQRFETHQQLCDQIIQGQRLFISEHSLLVPPQLQQLYDVYTKEGDNRRLERALALDTARFTVKERSLPKISVPLQSRVQMLDQTLDQTLDLDSDQESVRTVMLERGPSKHRRHTLPPIHTGPDLDSNRVFKNSPHAHSIKNSCVVTPPPIHINGKNREPLVPDSFLSFSLLSHSVSSHLDSSPESSEAGAELMHTERKKGPQNTAGKAARRRSRALDVLSLEKPQQRCAAPPTGTALSHATSDDKLSSSTGDATTAQSDANNANDANDTKSRVKLQHQSHREQSEGCRRKRRSRSFDVTGRALPQTKATVVQRLRPLDSTSDTHLHIGAPPVLRAQRGAACRGRGVAPGNLHTGLGTDSAPLSTLKRVPPLRPQHLHISSTQRLRRN
ncbi:unnamed protein product [Knipowitschia caucasica]|uniref:Kinesin-like protein n=1 Tax=Knipowitschia caucasica TaxID=637954 RepID=A0AAV2LDK2_KNICA